MKSTERNAVIKGCLYLVATPIGNTADLSERALKVLSEVDFIAAEDTRNSGMLLSRFGISKPFVSYFEHNKREHGLQIVSRLENGESCALITDAGTPAISDPGEDLVKLCAERNIPVTSIPGCCAAVTALSLSALPSRHFLFYGFLPSDKKGRTEELRKLETEQNTMIFYEAPHRLLSTLQDMEEVFGTDRRLAVCRELTKINEEVLRCSLEDAVRHFADIPPRGEFVLVVRGNEKSLVSRDYPESPSEHVSSLMDAGFSRMDAIKNAAKARGLSKGDFYRQLETEKAANRSPNEQ